MSVKSAAQYRSPIEHITTHLFEKNKPDDHNSQLHCLNPVSGRSEMVMGGKCALSL